jgi:hypothetical protein
VESGAAGAGGTGREATWHGLRSVRHTVNTAKVHTDEALRTPGGVSGETSPEITEIIMPRPISIPRGERVGYLK